VETKEEGSAEGEGLVCGGDIRRHLLRRRHKNAEDVSKCGPDAYSDVSEENPKPRAIQRDEWRRVLRKLKPGEQIGHKTDAGHS
jgi:hypothetical protein